MSGYRSGGNPSRLATRVNTAGELYLGDGSITSPTSATWTQVVASLSAESLVTRVTVAVGAGTFTNAPQFVDVAIGGAGAEVVKATVPLAPNATVTRVAIGTLMIPVRIAAGQRIAVRFSDNGFSGVTVTYTLYGMATANLETV
jgi:hypothetical protein